MALGKVICRVNCGHLLHFWNFPFFGVLFQNGNGGPPLTLFQAPICRHFMQTGKFLPRTRLITKLTNNDSIKYILVKQSNWLWRLSFIQILLLVKEIHAALWHIEEYISDQHIIVWCAADLDEWDYTINIWCWKVIGEYSNHRVPKAIHGRHFRQGQEEMF